MCSQFECSDKFPNLLMVINKRRFSIIIDGRASRDRLPWDLVQTGKFSDFTWLFYVFLTEQIPAGAVNLGCVVSAGLLMILSGGHR